MTEASNPLISVVINCYNGERYVKEAIDSVYAQHWPHWEIVFWDNASTDGTGEIAGAYDERLRYFRAEKNTPLGDARNLAFAQARGEFIAMLDSDDVYLPETLQMLVTGINEPSGPYAACYGGVIQIDADGREIGKVIPPDRGGNLFGDFLHNYDIWPCASMVRKSVLTASGHRFEGSLTTSEDVFFFMKLAVEHPIRSLGTAVARYRIHENALTNRSIGKWADEWDYTIDQIRRAYPGIEQRYNEGFRRISAKVDYYRARNLMNTGDRAAARKLLRRNVTVGPRYLALYLISILGVTAWNRVHYVYHKRMHFS